jgi:hypothetical protein
LKFVKVYHEVGRSVEHNEDDAVSRSLGDVETGVEDDHDHINEFSIQIIIIVSSKDDKGMFTESTSTVVVEAQSIISHRIDGVISLLSLLNSIICQVSIIIIITTIQC